MSTLRERTFRLLKDLADRVEKAPDDLGKSVADPNSVEFILAIVQPDGDEVNIVVEATPALQAAVAKHLLDELLKSCPELAMKLILSTLQSHKPCDK